MNMKWDGAPGGGRGRKRMDAGRTLLALVLLGAAGWLGCTSDAPDEVGVTAPGELQLNPAQVTVVKDVSSYGHVAVVDPQRPYDQNQVLYVGHDDYFRSAILVRYDFALPDTFPASVSLDETTVDSVYIRFFRLHAYDATLDSTGAGEPIPAKVYQVHELADTLDASRYPGPEPALGRSVAQTPAVSDLLQIPLPVSAFLAWAADGMTGLAVDEGPGSEPGLIGYASSELTEYSQIGLESADAKVGPVMVVVLDPALGIAPLAFVPVSDVSTMEILEPAPASAVQGMVVRTHVRDYPWFTFDLSSLPPGSFINRAELLLAPDTLANMGPLTTLVLSEIPLAAVDRDTIDLDVLDQATAVDGRVNVDPRSLGAGAPWLGFTATGSVQRFVNGVFEEPMVWLLSGPEDTFQQYDTSTLDPDFYLARIAFKGTGAGNLAPRLRITYTVFSGGER